MEGSRGRDVVEYGIESLEPSLRHGRTIPFRDHPGRAVGDSQTFFVCRIGNRTATFGPLSDTACFLDRAR